MNTKHHDSQLFLIRVWPDVANATAGSDGEVEWHGKLQHVVSGEAHTFHGCPELIEVLLQMLHADTSKQTEASAQHQPDQGLSEALA